MCCFRRIWMELQSGPFSHLGETGGARCSSKVRSSASGGPTSYIKPRPTTQRVSVETHGKDPSGVNLKQDMLCVFWQVNWKVLFLQERSQEDVKPKTIKDEPREMGQYLSLPSGTHSLMIMIHNAAKLFYSAEKVSLPSSVPLSPPDDALQLPPTPPSSNHGDSDGSLPPSSPHLPLLPSSPQPQQRPGGRASSSSSSSSSSAISSSPLLTAPHVRKRINKLSWWVLLVEKL